MPKKNRTDVSVRGETYTAVRDYCKERQVRIGPEVSIWVDEHLDRLEAQARDEPQVESGEQKLTRAEIEAETRKHFTF